MYRVVNPVNDQRSARDKKYIELICIQDLGDMLLVIVPTQGSIVRAVKKSEYVFEDEVVVVVVDTIPKSQSVKNSYVQCSVSSPHPAHDWCQGIPFPVVTNKADPFADLL